MTEERSVFITGANRGLGLEFARQYAADGWRVYGACRMPDEAADLAALKGELSTLPLDVADPHSVRALADAMDRRPLDLLINNAGVYGPRGASVGETDHEAWLKVFEVNVQGPMRVMEALLKNLRAGNGKTVVNISSRMGSITETGSGALIYRSSKAALNMAMRTAAHELDSAGFIVTLQSPGWVKTDMGGAGASLTPEESVAGMRQVIAGLTRADNGAFFSYDGSRIPW